MTYVGVVLSRTDLSSFVLTSFGVIHQTLNKVAYFFEPHTDELFRVDYSAAHERIDTSIFASRPAAAIPWESCCLP